MQFYSYEYLKNQSNFTNYLRYALTAIILVFLFLMIIKYLRHRILTKYRDLIVISLIAVVLLLGIQFTDYNQTKASQSQSSQVISYLKQVAEDQNVQPKTLLINSTSLSDGMIVRIKKSYYQVSFNSDYSAYALTKTHLVNPSALVINK